MLADRLRKGTGRAWPASTLPHPGIWGRAVLLCAVIGLGIILGILPWTSAAVLVVGALAVVITLIRPAVGLALVALLVPFGSLMEISIGPATIGFAEGMAALVIGAWVAHMLAFRRLTMTPNRLWILFGLLLGAMLLSVTQALSLSFALKELIKWMEFGALMLCAATAPEDSDRRRIIGAAFLGGIGCALLGWYQFLFRVGPEGFFLFDRFMRAYGTFRQPNPYAGYLGMILPVALAVVISFWPWRRGGRPADRVLWVLAAGAVVTAGPALLMSWSRGGWFGAGVAALAVILLRGRRSAILALAVLLVVLSAGYLLGVESLAPAALITRLTDFTQYFTLGDVRDVLPVPANWAVVERLAHWQAAEHMFAEHPWLGVGIGNYTAVYPAYRLPRWSDPLGHAHNYYLNIAAEAGLVGLGAYLLFWGAAFVVVWRVLRQNKGLWRGLALGTLGMLAHLTVHNVFDNLFVQGIYLQIALWVGLVISLKRADGNAGKNAELIQAD